MSGLASGIAAMQGRNYPTEVPQSAERGHFKMKRKRIQTGSVQLREDSEPAWWEGFYRENIVSEEGTTERKRRAVNLGTVKEIRSERAARLKLAAILEPMNDAKCQPKKMMTFRGFVEKYRSLDG